MQCDAACKRAQSVSYNSCVPGRDPRAKSKQTAVSNVGEVHALRVPKIHRIIEAREPVAMQCHLVDTIQLSWTQTAWPSSWVGSPSSSCLCGSFIDLKSLLQFELRGRSNLVLQMYKSGPKEVALSEDSLVVSGCNNWDMSVRTPGFEGLLHSPAGTIITIRRMMMPTIKHMRIFMSFHHICFLTRFAPRRKP